MPSLCSEVLDDMEYDGVAQVVDVSAVVVAYRLVVHVHLRARSGRDGA